MAYTKQTWHDEPAEDTPLSAARLGHIEDGVFAAAAVADAAAAAAAAATSVAHVFDVMAYGAVADAVLGQNDGHVTAAAAIFTSARASFTTADVGKTIIIGGAGAAGAPLVTTILSRQSATQVTLAVNASTTVTTAFFAYGTNDNTATQAALAAALAAKGTLLLAPTASLITQPLTISDAMTVRGFGWSIPFGLQATSPISISIPTQAPWVTGSVLVMASANTDIIDITAGGKGVHLRDFAGAFGAAFGSTGHGVSALPPTVGGGGRFDNGLLGATWNNLMIWGNDGDHYAYEVTNTLYSRLDGLFHYGGGGLHLRCNSGYSPNQSYGGLVSEALFLVTMVAGTGSALHLESTSGQTGVLNNLVFNRPSLFLLDPTSVFTALTKPNSTQKMFKKTGTINGVGIIGADLEFSSGLTGGVDLPSDNIWIDPSSYIDGVHRPGFDLTPPERIFDSTRTQLGLMQSLTEGASLGAFNDGALIAVANGYFDGTNYIRYDTAHPAWFLYLNTTGDAIQIFHAPAGANPATLTLVHTITNVGQVKSVAGNEATGAGLAALGANCPATTATAPYTWEKITTSDGSQCYFPVWK